MDQPSAFLTRSTSRRRFLATTVVGFAGALLAACSNQPPAAPAPAKTEPAKPDAAKPAAPAGAPAAAPAAGKPADAPAASAAPPGGVAQIPRNRTLIMAGLGGEHPGGFTDIDNFN